MRTNKFFIKYIMLSLLVGVGFTSCNDDDLGEAPRLFRPIVTLETDKNSITATWDNILGANSYEVILFQGNGEQTEDGNDIFEEIERATVASSPYTFAGLEWDEKYSVKVKAIGTNIESQYYSTNSISLVFPTPITEIRTIDDAILLLWNTNGSPITSLKIIPNEEGKEEVNVEVTEEEFQSGKKEVNGLTPETNYTVYAYSGEEQTLDTYQGRQSFTTQAPEDFEALYGAGKYLDLRSVSDSAEVLQSEQIQAIMEEIDGLAIILKGGFEYKVNNSIKFKNSITFITGLTLEGNAVFVQSGGFQSQSGATVDKVRFEKINFISDIANANPIRENEDAGFGGRQVYNVNGTNSVVNLMEFVNCRIEGYRAVVRFQQAGEGIKTLLFDECTFNGIGNQAAVTTTNLAGIIENVTFKNSTLSNIVMLCDLRASASPVNFNITDCTFCYAPIETTQNANTPLLRVGSNDVKISITNTIFGPSLATKGSAGSQLIMYTAGTAGSVMVNNADASVGVTNSYKTDFEWAVINDTNTYPIEGLANAGPLKELFAEPENEDYTIISAGFAGANNAGAIKWRMP